MSSTYQGTPCRSGHTGLRYNSGSCVQCTKEHGQLRYARVRLQSHEKSRKWRRENADRSNELARNWRIKNPAKVLLINAKRRAKQFKREFNLVLSDIIIPTVCPVLGVSFLLGSGDRNHPQAPSLDRIDNTKGYIKGNVWVISQRANYVKRDASLDELDKLVKALKALNEQDRTTLPPT